MKRTDNKTSFLRTGGKYTLQGSDLFILFAVLATMNVLAHGQTPEAMLPLKSLAFPQVATGPTIETVICVTNRGDMTYRGSLRFWKGSNQDWNPIVNGGSVSGSALNVTVEPGETKTFRIGGTSSLESGAALILPEDLAQDNFIEGNLTYSIKGHGYDSVGISPSAGLYRSVIPFEDFDCVGLALANSDARNFANVTLRLLDEVGAERETVLRVLPGRSHEARFLNEIFTTEVGTGKVEIESTAPILGTAVTLTGGEISALPMLPSPVAYTVSFTSLGRTDNAEAVLWAEGVYARGYLRFVRIDGRINHNPATYLLSGTLENGVLRLFLVGAGPDVGGREMINTLKIHDFSFDNQSYTGAYTRVYPWLSFPTHVLGNYRLVRRD